MAVPVFEISNHQQCVVIGMGLIGQQISAALATRYRMLDPGVFSVNWESPTTLLEFLQKLLNNNKLSRLDVIWSAGRAGFASSDEDMAAEYAFFKEVAELLTEHSDRIQFHHLSSAGGLYENSKVISHPDQTSATRAYGIWKLKQEQCLTQLGLNSKNYRISSVYGFSDKQGRKGLINTIIGRALTNQPVLVFGSQNTMRDYIFNRDIAFFITNQVNSNQSSSNFIVASGRPVSINTLINFIARYIKRPIHVNYVANYDNSSDIVFTKNVIPKDLTVTSLEEGVRLLCAHYKH